MSTPYHSKYFAYELTRRVGIGIDRISRSPFNAIIDLNLHKADLVLLASRSTVFKDPI